MKRIILIPARMASTRLPGKPLADIDGCSLLEHVWRRAAACSVDRVAVATDDDAIERAAADFGAEVIRTRPDHASGTDRLAEAAAVLDLDDADIVVNLQGDEPLMPPACLAQVADLLAADPAADMATLWTPIIDAVEADRPDVVKIVCARDGRALYFSRARIPHDREGRGEPLPRRHVGLYAYRAGRLRAWPDLPPSALERCERLEQLRALEAGWRIVAAEAAEAIPAGVDTPADLERVRAVLGAADTKP